MTQHSERWRKNCFDGELAYFDRVQQNIEALERLLAAQKSARRNLLTVYRKRTHKPNPKD